jgi:tRNA (mo5U34)-methyltransferase
MRTITFRRLVRAHLGAVVEAEHVAAGSTFRRVVTADEIRHRVDSFPRWHYEFDLQGVRTPIYEKIDPNRHVQRERYFLAPLVRACGGTLEGKRVLDLGCNAGWWSLKATEAGAEFVLGVDGRQMHIDQANLVYEANDIDPSRYRFEVADIFNHDFGMAEFDVVLNLGLMYHVSKPVDLIELLARMSSDIAVTDTLLAPGRRACFELAFEDIDEPRNAIDREAVLIPSRRAVEALGEAYGFSTVALDAGVISDFSGMDDYRDNRRRAFSWRRRPTSQASRRTPSSRCSVTWAVRRWTSPSASVDGSRSGTVSD